MPTTAASNQLVTLTGLRALSICGGPELSAAPPRHRPRQLVTRSTASAPAAVITFRFTARHQCPSLIVAECDGYCFLYCVQQLSVWACVQARHIVVQLISTVMLFADVTA